MRKNWIMIRTMVVGTRRKERVVLALVQVHQTNGRLVLLRQATTRSENAELRENSSITLFCVNLSLYSVF